MEYSVIPSGVDSLIQHKSDTFANNRRLLLDSKQHTLSLSFTDTDGSPKEIMHQFIITGPSLALSDEKTIISREKAKLFDKIMFYLKSKNAKLDFKDNQLVALKVE